MLDALYIKPNEAQEEPVCLQPAYFRRASSDGKQACFGSRHHLPDCSELNSHIRNTTDTAGAFNTQTAHSQVVEVLDETLEQQQVKTPQQKAVENQQVQSIEKSTKDDQGFVIDFSAKTVSRKILTDSAKTTDHHVANKTKKSTLKASANTEDTSDSAIKQSLAKLLTSLFRGSSLATSDVWVHTSETHKWRAKNLFVKLEEADVLENNAPRMYWGSISYADKEMMWLNVEGAKNIAIPLKLFQHKLIDKYALTQSSELKGARIILFAKCLANKDKSRKFLQLWSNDLQYLHLVLNSK